MKVTEAFKSGAPTLSFEFFPPKTPQQEEQLFEVIGQLKEFNPNFVSITYGALGTSRAKTFQWAKIIKSDFGLEPIAHLTCVAASRPGIAAQLKELTELGIENLLALRGDPPQNDPGFRPPADGFRYASELISFIKQQYPAFCVGAAGFPEKHPSSPDLAADIRHLKIKVALGAEFVITQLFFDNQDYFAFVDRCRQAGITVPIIPGVMPITGYKQIKKMTDIIGARIPAPLLEKIEKYQTEPETIKQLGVEQAINQCRGLLERGVPGLHFFVMNQSGPIAHILTALDLKR
ncbi:methylenetetrahydrofolate reductase [NAD(P)H] [candidate division WOR-1 bacterium RIFOXYB2_FULL_48_7]|uniref:Methylenetetrahydrofolate reductase n=1 Tax=candidate division WOR-1 bacterium RIFOXYB2_FULL_48_7 TaxID=1802583 RepID=A0A1F4TS90_UNCSA|nr:MAG: methylenetetrahydrofolate reductase [NAD(P)H] [candidate division WOR-1 bacterium RIFOXYB2_FULL_48_7]